MECIRCLYTTEIKCVRIGKSGQCNYCNLHDRLEKHSKMYNWDKELEKIKRQKRKYHCLIGISGGLDSSFMLKWSIEQGLNPLVIHFDNGWNSPEAKNNIQFFVKKFNCDFICYRINRKEYDDLCLAFLCASVPDADIPNDMAMAALMMQTAYKYGIKYIFNGHNFRTEGSSPISWSYMDAKYIKSVYEKHMDGKKLRFFPLLTFWDQVFYSFYGIKQVRPLYYVNPDMEEEKKKLIDLGWQDYGDKHSENLYTQFIGSYYLPVKFGINKIMTYHSALIRSGKMLKYTLQHNPIPIFDLNKIKIICDRLGIKEMMFDIIMKCPVNSFKDYHTYHKTFKRWKWLLWCFMKMGIIPYTFFKKYTLK